MKLILFDDAVADAWAPFALTRPAGELLFGALTLRARAERIFGVGASLHLAASHLQGFDEPGAPRVVGREQPPADGDRLFLCSRAVPAWNTPPVRLEGIAPGPIRVGADVAGWWAPAGTPAPDPDFLLSLNPVNVADTTAISGRTVQHVWDLISENPEQIATDIRAIFPTPAETALPNGAYCLGSGPVVLGEGVTVEPGVVFDTSDGPIWLDREVRIRAFTRIAGPAYIGPGSVVLGGSLEAVSVGPVCKVRGELAESVCVGYVNKAHDGHIGHAYLGRWVNLGAETTNSDLKNNYGTVRLWTPQGETDTETIKMGALLGDHVKTGIGLLLNTGTLVGAGSNLYGAEMPPRYVPPFSWGTGEALSPYRLDKFLEVAERAMARRDVALSAAARAQLCAAWDTARG